MSILGFLCIFIKDDFPYFEGEGERNILEEKNH